MASYVGKYAEYYDLIYADKPYEKEAAFLHESIKKYKQADMGNNLLEIACGSGRHALELEQLGYRVLATDYSEDLLNVARRKVRKAESNIEFRFADMRELELPEREFSTAICLFDSIGYAQTDAAIRNVFEGVHRHLLKGGIFVFEFWHADAMLKHFEKFRVRKWALDHGTLLRISETELMPDDNLAKVAYEIYELNHDLNYSMTRETQINRYFQVYEMKKFVEGAGFEALKWLNGYTWNEDIDDSTWHILCIARAH